jgi:hypothetical protein
LQFDKSTIVEFLVTVMLQQLQENPTKIPLFSGVLSIIIIDIDWLPLKNLIGNKYAIAGIY